jgi:hypothetical protein
MGFLDNLENNLKALENREERDPEKIKRDQERREAERNESLARAPYVEALKSSPFTSELLTQCRMLGREFKVLVRFTWLQDVLRLDAGPKRLELIPTAEGIVAVHSADGEEQSRKPIDVSKEDAAKLVRSWLSA